MDEMSDSVQIPAIRGDEVWRPFATRVTLGRARPAQGAEAGLEALTSALRSPMNPPPGGRLAADRADLMKNEPGPGGPVYTVLHESPLKE